MLVKRTSTPIFNWFTGLSQIIVPVRHKISGDFLIWEREAHNHHHKWLRQTYIPKKEKQNHSYPYTLRKHLWAICIYSCNLSNSHSHMPLYHVASSERNKRAGDKKGPQISWLLKRPVGCTHHTQPRQLHRLVTTKHTSSHCKTIGSMSNTHWTKQTNLGVLCAVWHCKFWEPHGVLLYQNAESHEAAGPTTKNWHPVW